MNYQNIETVRASDFSNTYGGLDLVKDGDGVLYLRMSDCMGDSFFGPLTQDQVAAFELLCNAPEVH
jgi:hypothetical protein